MQTAQQNLNYVLLLKNLLEVVPELEKILLAGKSDLLCKIQKVCNFLSRLSIHIYIYVCSIYRHRLTFFFLFFFFYLSETKKRRISVDARKNR